MDFRNGIFGARMNAWIDKMFDAKIVDKEGIVRRKKSDVHKQASFKELLAYARDYQFHLIETGNQYIVICNAGAIKIHC
jgi:hypothetical protein